MANSNLTEDMHAELDASIEWKQKAKSYSANFLNISIEEISSFK